MSSPPRLADQLLRFVCAPDRLEEVQGDLHEEFAYQVERIGERRARWRYWRDVLGFIKPFAIKRKSSTRSFNHYPTPTNTTMLRNYLKIAFRNLVKNKAYSFINIGGLAVGMAVAMLIGLWLWDELSYDKYHKNYDSIAQVWSGGTDPETRKIGGSISLQFPMGDILRTKYKHYFKHVLMAWWVGGYTLKVGDKNFQKTGEFIEAGAPEMLSLNMLKGSYSSLSDMHSIILSKSTAEAIFGNDDPINKSLKIDNRIDVKVTGVYEDLPKNTRFGEVQFFSTWPLWVASNEWIKKAEHAWDNRSFNIYVQLQPKVSMASADAGIRDFHYKNLPSSFLKEMQKYKPFVQLVPMSTWHLYSEFVDGKPAAGRITFVWLFGIIGVFVLLLACINFMNLSTARSEKRAKEVGIRKAIGSIKWQLVNQFMSESFLVVVLAFALAILLVLTSLSWFNELADKDMTLPFTNPVFWLISLLFITLTGFLAGLYPAFYLSSFQPVKVLKGTIRLGRFAALPRKILVVVQFTVSVVLVIGTIIVYQQIQHARNRPIGYNREGLINLSMNDPNYKGKHELLKSELINTGMVSDVAFSSNPLTAVWSNAGGYDWRGKDPQKDDDFAICEVSYDFGKTVGWQFLDGRDFSRAYSTDSSGLIINETAAKYMNLKSRTGGLPIGEFVKGYDKVKTWKIIGVIKDLVMDSPYEPVKQTFFFLDKNYSQSSQLTIRIKPTVSTAAAVPQIEGVIKKLVPSASFDYKFVDEQYAAKFSAEERIGKLASFFAALAILISCLGLFGLASFVAEQRTKEIGVRKVLGATVTNLWGLLSKDFVFLVIISCLIAVPIAWYFMSQWLQKYDYHTNIEWWIFAAAGIGALVITLLTVSFQAIKAALMNPITSLRSE
ncbi:FtsX-like permease family protein [Spirosoma litoris]